VSDGRSGNAERSRAKFRGGVFDVDFGIKSRNECMCSECIGSEVDESG